MTADEPTDAEAQLADALAAYDDVLAAGIPADFSRDHSTPSAPSPRLERNLACLQLLRRRWPGPKLERDSVSAIGPIGTFVQLGHFEIRRELGRGGYGVVFLAHDRRLGRDVALKIPRADLFVSVELRARFQQEARAAAALEHAHIVSVYEAGEAGPVYYIASAYCPGITLSEWLQARTEPVPAREAACLVAALADGVQHAHSRGVLHRDLKPANVLLEVETLSPKITDFGLAKVLQEEGTGAVLGAVTQSGTIVGTPNYMSPEQARGQSKEITIATDIYALGVILYEILTGRLPFRGATPLETLRQIEAAEPLAPSRLRGKLPRDLETICLKCLRKVPHERYASAAALAEDLRRFLADEPIRARPIGMVEWLLKWARRRPERAALVGVVSVAMVALLVAGVWYNARLNKALQSAEQKREESNRNFALARQAVEDYLTKVTENKRLTEADFHALRKDLLQAALPFYEKFVTQTENDPELRAEQGRAYERLGKVRHETGEIDQALVNYRQMQAIFDELTRLHPEVSAYIQALGQAHTSLGEAFDRLGRFDEAEREHAQAIAIQSELAEKYPGQIEYRRDLGFSHFSRAMVLAELGRREEMVPEYRQSQVIHAQLVKEVPSNADYRRRLAWSHNNLGNNLCEMGRYEEGEPEIRKALLIKKQLIRDFPTDPEYQVSAANSYIALGNLFHRRHFDREAEAEERAALAILQEVSSKFPSVPNYHARLAQCHNNVGQVLRDMGRRAEAKEQFQSALTLNERLAAEHPEIAEHGWGVADTKAHLAWLVADEGHHGEAAAALGSINEHAAGSGMARYDIACGWSLALAAVVRDRELSTGERDKLADKYASNSLHWLKKSAEAGYFRDGANADLLATDACLTPPLRSQVEFQKLVTNLVQGKNEK
jgi:serine/threonine protein kinase